MWKWCLTKSFISENQSINFPSERRSFLWLLDVFGNHYFFSFYFCISFISLSFRIPCSSFLVLSFKQAVLFSNYQPDSSSTQKQVIFCWNVSLFVDICAWKMFQVVEEQFETRLSNSVSCFIESKTCNSTVFISLLQLSSYNWNNFTNRIHKFGKGKYNSDGSQLQFNNRMFDHCCFCL